jgi:aspartyl-tRNA(Asn)/glutamyl-tRNA(Gln) amidotransferase subunit A
MPPDGGLLDLELTEVAEQIRLREISPVEVTRATLDAIAVHDSTLSAFITVTEESAMQAAEAAEKAIGAGYYLGPLHGVPLAIKDIVSIRDQRSTSGSKILADHVPAEDATVSARLRASGAVFVGKLNMHEFAFGVTTENPHYGTTKNPWNLAHSAGGSSGGSGSAVAARLCYGALGTDTGCSVRLPASYCGISGIRPSIGRVSNFGVGTLAWTLDTVGPMARSSADCAAMLSVISGYDARDPQTSKNPVPDLTGDIERGLAGLRLGLIADYSLEGLQDDVRLSFEQALALLEESGATIREVPIPDLDLATSALMTIDIAEPAAYHAQWLRDRPQDYGDDIRTLLEQGEMYTATQYIQAQRYRSMLHRSFTEAMHDLDAIITPSVPYTSPRIGERTVSIGGKDIGLIDAIMRYQALPPLAGMPALSVPCGFSSEGLPVGMQIIGDAFDESTVLRIGHAFQRLTDWHRRKPPLLS